MLINVTAFPFDDWPEEQKEAAIKRFEDVCDFLAPDIDPAASIDDVGLMAEEYLRVIAKREFCPAVLVAGELSFTFILVHLLLERDYRVFTVTTRPKVVVNPDGTQTVCSEFVRFREYVTWPLFDL